MWKPVLTFLLNIYTGELKHPLYAHVGVARLETNTGVAVIYIL
jgi:hypothetical protein